MFFRRFEVGQVTAVNLDEDGKGVTALVFIRSPNEKYVTQNTRFWEASGVDVSIDGSGVKISTQSLVSIAVGGIAFQTPTDEPAGDAAENDRSFRLFSDETLAMKRSEQQLEKYIAYFTDSIRGLAVGAQVEFRGFVIGEVRSIEMEFDRDSRTFRFPVEFALYRDVLPARIARAEKPGVPIDSDELYERAIQKRGLRVQLRTGNLLTGTKYLAMDFIKDAAPVPVGPAKDRNGSRIIPTAPGSFEELQETLSSISKKIDKIPFEQLATEVRRTLQQLQGTMKGAEKLLANVNDNVAPEVAATLNEAKRTMKSANDALLATDSPIQQDLRGTLVELNRAAASLRLLTDYLQRHPESLLRGKAPDVTFGDLPPSPPPAVPMPAPPSSKAPVPPETVP